jgi:hypothetical protein
MSQGHVNNQKTVHSYLIKSIHKGDGNMTAIEETKKKPLWLSIEKQRFKRLPVNLILQVTMFRAMGAICSN